MRVVDASAMGANLKEVMDQMVRDRDPVVVTRPGGESVVVVSLAAWPAMDETAHLLSTPANAAGLREAVRQLDAGGNNSTPSRQTGAA